MLFLKVLKLHLWPKTQHIKNSHFLFLEFFSVFLSLCCSHTLSHIPEDGVNVMVMTCFLVSMRIRRCQSFLPWGSALAQPRSKEVLGDEWIRMHKSKQISNKILLSFFAVEKVGLIVSFRLVRHWPFYLLHYFSILWTLISAVNCTAPHAYACVRYSFSLPF